MRITPHLYWIDGTLPGHLAISARPRGGDWLEDEVFAWRESGVAVVASLLTPSETAELSLEDEPTLCAMHGLAFLSLPIPDRDIPESDAAALELVSTLGAELERGRGVLIHCRQGVGRSGMIAAAVLIAGGCTADDAMRAVSSARGLPVPETDAQAAWLSRMAARLAPAR
jgi:protein-tyrosine phosphatase